MRRLFRPPRWPTLFLFVLTIIVILDWFRTERTIYFWDGTFPLNPGLALNAYASVWNLSLNLGNPDFTAIKYLPYFAIIYFLHSVLNLPLYLAQSLMYAGILFGAGYGMYIFVQLVARSVFPSEEAETFVILAAISAALFYMFNLYSILFLWRIFSSNTFLYFALPYFFYLIVQFAQGRVSIKLVSVGLLVSVLASVSDPALFLPLGGLLGAFVITAAIQKIGQCAHFNWKPLLIGPVLVVPNLYWMIPTIALLGNSGFPTSSLYGGTISALFFNSRFANLLDVVTLRGQQILFEQFRGEFDYPWVQMYRTGDPSGLYLISFLIPIFGAISILKVRNKHVAFFASSAVIFGFLVKGVHDPLGAAYLWAFKLVPAFVAFRDPYQKFGLFYSFCLSVLFGIGLPLAVQRATRRISRAKLRKYLRIILPVIVLTLVCGVYAWPMWTGAVIPQGTAIRPSAAVEIPGSYYQLSDYILQHGPSSSRVLLLPFQSSPLQSSLWSYGYVGYPVIRSLTSAPVFFGITGSTIEDKLSIAIARGIDRNSSNIANLLSNLGIRYVVVDESTNPSFDPSASSYKTVEHFLNEADALHVVSRFGSLLLYELNVYQPIFSTTTNFQLLSPNMNRTDIALSGISPEYGNGTLSITQDGIQTLCRIKQPSDYCDFGLGGLNYDVETLPFFILQFSSDAHSTVSMSFTEVNGTSYWPLALDANSPTYNRYNSTVPVVIAYNLRDVFSSSLKAIHVHVNADSSASPNSTLGIAITGAYMAETPPQLTIDAVISFLSNHNLALHPAVFSNENVFFESQNLSGRVPSLTFDKVDPGSYAIHVSNATSSFFLLFDEMYDDSWFASANSQPNTGFLHFQGNGFQNAWLIDKTGSYDIEIRYTPQALFNFWERMGLALTLSIFSSVLAIESKTRLRSLLRMTLARARSKFGLRRS